MKIMKWVLLAPIIWGVVKLIIFIGEPDYFRVSENKIDRFLEKITQR